MTIRFVQGDSHMGLGYPVATAQAIERFDMVALKSDSAQRAQDETWGTAHTAPAAPTLADGPAAGDTALTNALTGVLVTAQFPWGEGIIGTPGTVTPTAARRIKCTLAALPTNALYWNVYVETAAGSGTYKLWRSGFQGSQIIWIDAYGAGHVPYANNVGGVVVPTTALEMTQYTFAQTFLGVSNQRKVVNIARIFGNSRDNEFMCIRGPGAIIEVSCVSASFSTGDFVAPAKDTGNTLTNQTVVEVIDQTLAIGRVARKETTVTKVMVEMFSQFIPDISRSGNLTDQ